MDVKIGDIVARKSYQCDLLFRVIDIKERDGEREAILHGEDVRLVADAPCSDLVIIDEQERQERKKREIELIEQAYRLFRQDYQTIKQKVEYRATGGYRVEKDFFKFRDASFIWTATRYICANAWIYMNGLGCQCTAFTVRKVRCQRKLAL